MSTVAERLRRLVRALRDCWIGLMMLNTST